MRIILIIGAVLGLFVPTTAFACGGFFCNAAPVDQQAERIIFVQEDENTITSYVEIAYAGDPENFAWIVPVPSVPSLDTWNGQAFNGLDLATQPTFNFQNDCFLGDAEAAGGAPPNAMDDGVMVLARERVGPFDTVTLESDDPRELVEWLRVNDFRIVPAMEPFVALYTAEGMKFLAMKLAPGEESDAIEPIKMTYSAASPAVPLRLTSVAAQLEMGVKIWILSDQRYGPKNVPDLVINDEDLAFDPWNWTHNYLALVARSVDANGGHGFVTELATPTAPLADMVRDSFVPERLGQEALDARDAVVALLESKPYITRLYSRLSPEEMDIDPIFHAVGGNDVSNIHDIPAPEGVEDLCGGPGEENGRDACDFMACGQGGVCAPAADNSMGAQAGCACAPGSVARVGIGPDGQPFASCGDERLNFSTPSNANTSIAFPDICTTNDFCGSNGECVMLNGFPSCRCDAGFLAVPERDAQGMWVPTCISAVQPDTLDLSAITLREPNLPYPGRSTEVGPMPIDMSDLEDNESTIDDTMAESDITPPEERSPGLMTSNQDDGCATTAGEHTPLWMICLVGLLLVSRGRSMD